MVHVGMLQMDPKRKKIVYLTIQLFTFRGTMQLHMLIGQEVDFHQRVNGNMQLELVKETFYFLGEILNLMMTFLRHVIFGKVNFQILILLKMVF